MPIGKLLNIMRKYHKRDQVLVRHATVRLALGYSDKPSGRGNVTALLKKGLASGIIGCIPFNGQPAYFLMPEYR